MIINLSKPFRFQRDQNEYSGVYVFKNHESENGRKDVCLELKVSVNKEKEQLYQVNKPTDVLFQSNEVIEEMIANEIMAFSTAPKNK